MIFIRYLAVVCGFFVAIGQSFAQNAQDIVDSAAKVYAAANSYSADVDTRMVLFSFPEDGSGGGANFQNPAPSQYRRLQLRVRRPNDYLLGTQNFSDNTPESARISWTYIARTDTSLPKQGLFTGDKFSVRDLPAEQFNAMINSRLGFRASEDVVLRHFQSQSSPLPGRRLGIKSPELIGRENSARPLYRIVAKTSDGFPLMLWIEQESFLIVRSVVQRPRVTAPVPNGPSPVAPRLSGGNQLMVVETLYKNQRIDAPFSSASFTIMPGERGPRPNAADMGFSSLADLAKTADVQPLSGAPDTSDNDELDNAADESGAKPANAVSAPSSPTAPVGQALTYEQMSGIVLIDGDSGTATGFMTKIRDVDFVVTNQHVLVGNKKITIKTLGGEEIPPLGIFGAIGSDIAIIRVPKGLGTLRLSEDVFKANKLGDPIVVVGNRQGGGVATQTAGTIKGIGPKLIEVDANFQSGNSGSPIVNVASGEVVGVATYSETRRVDVDGPAARGSASSANSQIEKRWFGYRVDGVSKWESIDLAKWNAQSERIQKFRETSEALHAVIKFQFRTARQNPRLTNIIDSFDARYRAASSNGITAATEVKDLFRVIRTISDDGVRELSTGDYYDYYRTCQYWENSIGAQLEYRKAIIEVLKKYESNSSQYLSRMRDGGGN